MPYSHAVATAIICLENYLDEEIPLEINKEGKATQFKAFLDEVRGGIHELRFTEKLLSGLSPAVDFAKLRTALAAVAGNDSVFEYFAGVHALDALYRIERSKERILEVISLLPASVPPPRSQRYLARVIDCFLSGFDAEAIIMTRAAVEVLVEERWNKPNRLELAAMIKSLEREDVITKRQADDLWEINRQARELIHDEPHRRPTNALDCIRRLARILEQLHPLRT